MNKPSNQNQVVILKANHDLRSKVGSGKIPPKTVLACRQVLETHHFDFRPQAKDLIEQLGKVIRRYKDGALSEAATLDELTIIIMQIKGNAGVFHHKLLSDLAASILLLIEEYRKIDAEIIEIIETFAGTSLVILEKGIRNINKERSEKILNEFLDACDRYRELERNR